MTLRMSNSSTAEGSAAGTGSTSGFAASRRGRLGSRAAGSATMGSAATGSLTTGSVTTGSPTRGLAPGSDAESAAPGATPASSGITTPATFARCAAVGSAGASAPMGCSSMSGVSGITPSRLRSRPSLAVTPGAGCCRPTDGSTGPVGATSGSEGSSSSGALSRSMATCSPLVVGWITRAPPLGSSPRNHSMSSTFSGNMLGTMSKRKGSRRARQAIQKP